MKKTMIFLCGVSAILSEIALPIGIYTAYLERGYWAVGGEYAIAAAGVLFVILGIYFALSDYAELESYYRNKVKNLYALLEKIANI